MDLTQKSDAEILAVAGPIIDNLMDASTAIDYEGQTRDFTERAKSVLSKESLQTICEHYQSAKGFVSLWQHSGARTLWLSFGGSGSPGNSASSWQN